MLTFRTALPARFDEEDAMRRRFTEAWLATGTVPVAHIVADPDLFDDAATGALPGGATPVTAAAPTPVDRVVPADTIVQWIRVALKAKIPGMYTRTSA